MRINTTVGSVSIKIDTKRINKNLREAQKALNIAVRDDTESYVPVGATGHLGDSFRFGNDDPYAGFVMYDIDYAHYHYIGLVRTDKRGRTWVGKNEEKPILHTDWPMKYQQSGATSEWFRHSKEKNLSKWIKIVKEEVGKE